MGCFNILNAAYDILFYNVRRKINCGNACYYSVKKLIIPSTFHWMLRVCNYIFYSTLNSSHLTLNCFLSILFLGVFATECCRSLPISSALPICMQQLENSWMDFHEIWYWEVLLKFVCTFQCWLKSDDNNGHFTWRPTHTLEYEINPAVLILWDGSIKIPFI
jgi:hypothetical protein